MSTPYEDFINLPTANEMDTDTFIERYVHTQIVGYGDTPEEAAHKFVLDMTIKLGTEPAHIFMRSPIQAETEISYDTGKRKHAYHMIMAIKQEKDNG